MSEEGSEKNILNEIKRIIMKGMHVGMMTQGMAMVWEGHIQI
jgi:hypothetical protein